MADDKTDINITVTERVGETLRAAREAKKMSISEVSSQIRLLSGRLESLESGEWDELYGRTYARGYFISYVKFLGLNESEMLAAFNKEFSTTLPESPSLLAVNLTATKGFPWGQVIIIIGLLVLLWFCNQKYQIFPLSEFVGYDNNAIVVYDGESSIDSNTTNE
jgi:cytoskeleton protein RodZ